MPATVSIVAFRAIERPTIGQSGDCNHQPSARATIASEPCADSDTIDSKQIFRLERRSVRE
jgi:hypothetical protein